MSEQYNQNARTESMSTHVSLRHGHIDTDNLARHAHVILPSHIVVLHFKT